MFKKTAVIMILVLLVTQIFALDIFLKPGVKVQGNIYGMQRGRIFIVNYNHELLIVNDSDVLSVQKHGKEVKDKYLDKTDYMKISPEQFKLAANSLPLNNDIPVVRPNLVIHPDSLKAPQMTYFEKQMLGQVKIFNGFLWTTLGLGVVIIIVSAFQRKH